MQTQLSFHPFSGSELKNAGIKVAADNADRVHENWSEDAYLALKTYIRIHKQPFMCEEVRDFAHIVLGLPQPPSARAWGSVMKHAAKQKIISRIGTGQVTNPKAHCANAGQWIGA